MLTHISKVHTQETRDFRLDVDKYSGNFGLPCYILSAVVRADNRLITSNKAMCFTLNEAKKICTVLMSIILKTDSAKSLEIVEKVMTCESSQHVMMEFHKKI